MIVKKILNCAVLCAFSLCLLEVAVAADFVHPESAARARGESSRSAYLRYLSKHPRNHHILDGKTVLESQSSYSQLDLSKIPVWSQQQAKVKQAFAHVRDLRFLKDPEEANFMRRSSWMYPDDGCFARAALMGDNLEQLGLARPAKVFIFGDLEVKTSNSPSASVSWWYHVVPIIKVGQVPIVFDPAIDPRRPLPLLDWIKTMTPNINSVRLSICNPRSYVPNSECDSGISDARKMFDQGQFLAAERARIKTLGRNPDDELGDHPPWLSGQSQRFNAHASTALNFDLSSNIVSEAE